MKYTYNYILLVYVLASFVSKGQSAQGKGDCILKNEDGFEVSYYQWEWKYNLKTILDTTPVNTNILNFTYENINESRFEIIGMNSQDMYVDAKISKNKLLKMWVDTHFQNYEDEEIKASMEMKFDFKCKNGESSSIIFVQPIEDTNNHSPEFLKTPYKYTIPMPIPKGFDFQVYGQILARDVDLTNNLVTFSFDPTEKNKTEGLVVASFGKDEKDPKNFPAMLQTSMTMDLEEDITFKLFVTDNGRPKRTAETTVTIAIDKENSFPRFSDPVYIADLTSLDYHKVDKVTLKFIEGKNITLTRGYGGVNSFKLSGISDENKKHFKLTHNKATKDGINIQVDLSNITEKFISQKALSVILTAVKEKVEAYTILDIILPVLEKSNNVSVTEKPICEESSTKVVKEDESTNGYMVATIMLSLTSLGLLGYVIFLHVKPKLW